MSRIIIAAMIIVAASACTEQADVAAARDGFGMADGVLFPADRSLTHAEDGVVLADGSVLVGDWDSGLVLLAPDGAKRVFGDFAAAGFKARPAPDWNSPNGVSLEPDGRHALVADITSGHIYRVDVESEAVARIYDHPYGVNNVVRDPSGAIWFTQSTENAEGEGSEARMFAAADRPLTDGAVFRIAPGAVETGDVSVERVVGGLAFANGVAYDAGRGRLYVAELMAHRVLAFDVDAATGALSNRRILADIVTPDNIELDDRGDLWVASPVANAVYIVDPDAAPDAGAVRTFFAASPETSAALVAEVRRRSENNEGILDLIGPEMSGPMPGLLTGVILSPRGGPVYISGLGDALVRIDRD